ncbi:MAG: dTMP kinase [Armatimonadetes bacterium]|nr:dTMP kinase [Armatimonadota bacterium]MDE2206064.1 dTMP kinase [Armatimonadota bacterium]
MQSSIPGVFISLEGVDGSGKTTQAARLCAALQRDGEHVLATREPGGDSVSEAVRALVLATDVTAPAELLLFLAARAQHVAIQLRPFLEAGGVLICDRYADSTVAYQGYGRGLDLDTIATINRFATGGLMPHLTVLIDLDPKVGMARQQQANRMEREPLAFHQRVRDGYAVMARAEPDRFAVFDGSLPSEQLQESIYERAGAAIATIRGSTARITEGVIQ